MWANISVFRIVLSIIFCVGFFFGAGLSFAQNDFEESPGGGDPIEYTKDWIVQQSSDERLTVYGTNLLGDSVDPDTGALTFAHSDVSIPGNSNLDVAIRRRLSQSQSYHGSVQSGFGDWVLQVPMIREIYARPAYPSADHCSMTQPPPVAEVGELSFIKYKDYSNGLNMEIPGRGTQAIARYVNGPQWPSGVEMATKDNWKITCLPIISNISLEGMLATAPDGTSYRFDKGLMRRAHDSKSYESPLIRDYVVWLATEVKDVNGNWVRYNYDGEYRLTSITSSDGRRIDLTYSGDLISSVTANGRLWTYQYDNVGRLIKVTRPDNLSWSFDLSAMSISPRPGAECDNESTDNIHSMSILHPNGVTVEFTINEIRHFKKDSGEENLAGRCREETTRYNKDHPRAGEYASQPRHPFFETMSVIGKSLSGQGYPSAKWTWNYEGYVNGVNYGDLKWTEMTDPVGNKTKWYHDRNSESQEGLLIKTEQRRGNSVLKTVQNQYTNETKIGSSWLTGNADVKQLTARHIASVVTNQDGDTYTKTYNYNTNQSSSYYSFGQPTSVSVKSNVNTTPRETVTEYEHNTSKWILGLPKTVTVNDRETVSYIYNDFGQKTEEKRYGKRYATYGYHTNAAFKGAPYWVRDANNRQTAAYGWKRGTPQDIWRPDGKHIYQYVDNNGWMTSSKDALGRTTIYTRDNMGRLTKYDPPGDYFAHTDISYDFSGGGAVQTITKADAKTVVTYDSMFRPTLEETRDMIRGESTFVNTKYDALGRVSFKSQPSTNYAHNQGIAYKYDGLGRITHETETASGGVTWHQYLNSHRHRVRDPENRDTMYYSYGYEGPGNTDYRAIYQSASGKWLRYTNIYKNIWGEVTWTRQRDPGDLNKDQRQYFFYNSDRRLCGYRDEEGGDTLYHYDPAGQMIAYAKGQSNASNNCPLPSGTAKVSLTYDKLGQLTKTDFTDPNTPDIYRTYDAVGNLKTNNRGGANWSYTYKEDSDLLVYETLKIDGRTYRSTHWNSAAGHRYIHRTPSNRLVVLSPDGLGRNQTAGEWIGGGQGWGEFYGRYLRYHPSGQVKSMKLGNGHDYNHYLNDRQLTSRITTENGSTKALDLSFTYTRAGQIQTINDAAIADNNRSFTYDGLGQLETANGPWGSGVFKYDGIGNILEKNLGNRKVVLSYDSRNRVNKSVDTGNWGTNPNSGTRTIAYDERGNVTTLGDMTFVYDYNDQPVHVSGKASGTYQYDGHGKRVKSVVDGKTIYNVYDSAGRLIHIDNVTDSEKTDYIFAGGMTIARVKNGVTTYLHNDQLGSPLRGTSSDGSVTFTELYTPFGIPYYGSDLNKDQAGFTGHIRDGATDLNYMQARYYDPVIGRFLSVDPVDFVSSGYNPGMFNRYAYTMNDPINLIDPDGRACTKTTGSNLCNRNYKTKIKSGRQAEKAERNHLRTNDKERIVSGRVSASYEKDDSYKRGREYDIVSQTKDGHYNLTEVKFRKTKSKDIKSGIKPLEGGQLVWRIYQGVVTAQQASFDLNSSGEDITLKGKGIPGGELTLSPDQYTITWVLANQHGKAIGANIDASNTRGIQEILDKFVVPD